MYTVILVDDEPAAIHYIAAIIEKKCRNFKIIATANDGYEALKLVRKLKPDVLVFDICMPVVDGIIMSAKVKELNLPVIMVVISGHSEFEYAQMALKNGAVDYLLKPVVPKEAQITFQRIENRLEISYHQERMKLLSLLYKDKELPLEHFRKYFTSEKYYIALARMNGLPSRFSSINTREVFSDLHEMMITYGRDEMENLYLCPVELVGKETFEDVIRKQIGKVTSQMGYSTIILYKEAILDREIGKAAKRLYQLLDQHVIAGEDTIVFVEDYQEKVIELDETERNLLNEFDYYMQKQDFFKLKGLLRQLLQVWGSKKRPVLWMERQIRNMNYTLETYGNGKKYNENYLENEYALEEAFSSSATLSQLINSIEEILFKDRNCQIEEQKLDTENFVDRVCQYFKRHMDKDITIQDISLEFGVSQTYLGKLFRKYRGMSFKNYLTMIKMEKAKELLQGEEILIKDVAERLGYRDQFYFSRVFRSYTGTCPTDFIESGKTNQ